MRHVQELSDRSTNLYAGSAVDGESGAGPGDVLVHVIEPLPRLVGGQEPGHVHDLTPVPEIERGRGPHRPLLGALRRIMRRRRFSFHGDRGGGQRRKPMQQSQDTHHQSLAQYGKLGGQGGWND